MRIERLILKNFRNYEELDWSVPPGVVALVGANGQGKTNLIEAIHLLLRGASFRPGSSDTWLRRPANSEVAGLCFVKARLEKQGLSHLLQWTSRLGHKKLEWNDKKTSGVRLANEFAFVLFSPESLAAIKEGPEQRRRLVDEVLLGHSSVGGEILKEFTKALKTRNRLLKDFKQGKSSSANTIQLLESLDPIYLPLATELTWLRLNTLHGIHSDLQNVVDRLFVGRPAVQLDYLISARIANHWTRHEILNAMHNRSLELRRSELESGVTLVGPHRHDLRFLFAGKDSRYFCSQGQQRALILSYKMAQIMYHHRTHQVYPFLLLDDVLSELDPERRQNLLRFMKEVPSQIFLTTTDLSFSTDFGDRNLSVLRIENGVITSAGYAKSLRRDIDSSP